MKLCYVRMSYLHKTSHAHSFANTQFASEKLSANRTRTQTRVLDCYKEKVRNSVKVKITNFEAKIIIVQVLFDI